MKLKDWCKQFGVSAQELTRMLGLRSPATVYTYLREEKIPLPETMGKIAKVTDGRVMPNDFYNLKNFLSE